MKSYLHTFDRRNSDTTYLLGRRSSGERVNLADEIRKLSDHLLMLAEINTKLGDSNNNASSTESSITQEGNKVKSSTRSTRVTSLGPLHSSSSSSQTQVRSTDGQQKISSLSVRLQQSIEETPKLSNGNSDNSWSKSQLRSQSTVSTMSTANAKSHVQKSSTSTNSSKFSSSISTSNSFNASSSNHAFTESASSRRAKFRINQMSRDVPIGLPDTHQTVNLEEAANTTKDCLLHLLEKYNETKIRNPVGRHQSISVDWHISDNLEYRSMSSINAFFQRHSHSSGGQNVKHIQAQLEEKATGK